MRYLLLLLIYCYSSFSLGKVYDSVNIPEVFQREYIHTDFNNHKFVQTFGVYTCVAVVIYSANKSAVLAHFDAATKVDRSIDLLLKNFSTQETLTITLLGGQPPFKLEQNISKNLEEKGFLVNKTIRNRKNESLSIILSLESGELFKYDENISSTDWRVSREKVDRLKFEKKLYRHENSIGGGDFLDIIEQNSMEQFNFLDL